MRSVYFHTFFFLVKSAKRDVNVKETDTKSAKLF